MGYGYVLLDPGCQYAGNGLSMQRDGACSERLSMTGNAQSEGL